MKKLFTLALIFTAMMFCSAVHAQTGTAVKTTDPAAKPAPAAQDTTKKDTKQPPAASQSDNKKEDPASAPGSGAGAPGGTRMAINEQGVPTKKTAKPKAANANTSTSDPAPEPEKKKSEK